MNKNEIDRIHKTLRIQERITRNFFLNNLDKELSRLEKLAVRLIPSLRKKLDEAVSFGFQYGVQSAGITAQEYAKNKLLDKKPDFH